MVKKKISKEADFEVLELKLQCDYKKDEFIMKCANKELNKNISRLIKLSEMSDFAEMLISSVKKKIKAKQIDYFKLYVDFTNKKTELDIYFVNENNEALHENIKDIY